MCPAVTFALDPTIWYRFVSPLFSVNERLLDPVTVIVLIVAPNGKLTVAVARYTDAPPLDCVDNNTCVLEDNDPNLSAKDKTGHVSNNATRNFFNELSLLPVTMLLMIPTH